MNTLQDTTNWKLKAAILQARLKQYQLALAIGIEPGRFSKIIGGYATATPEQKAQLAKILKTSTRKLFAN